MILRMGKSRVCELIVSKILDPITPRMAFRTCMVLKLMTTSDFGQNQKTSGRL
jgi:hypothetical protein